MRHLKNVTHDKSALYKTPEGDEVGLCCVFSDSVINCKLGQRGGGHCEILHHKRSEMIIFVLRKFTLCLFASEVACFLFSFHN